MGIEREFIDQAVKKAKIDRFLHEELKNVGCGEIDIKRTPLGTKITIYAKKPGLVIGRKGETIQKLTETLKDKFDVENPQLEVKEVSVPDLDPEIMSKQLASALESGVHFRRASYRMMKQIMGAGALGVQIEISGKISGSRARNEKFKSGYLKHCGETAEKYVKEAVTDAVLKQGVLGVKVKIVPPVEEGTLHELAFEGPEASVEESSEEIEEKPEKEKQEKKGKEKKEEKSKKSKKKKEKKKEKKSEKEDLSDKSYRELQKMAKKHDIKANQKKEELIEELKKKSESKNKEDKE